MIPLDEPVSHRCPGVSYGQLRAELQREIATRARTYPGQVDKGRMTAAEAARQQALAAAWLEDLDLLLDFLARCRADWQATRHFANRIDPGEPAHAFTWAERRAGLNRELAQRARLFPQWIAKGNLSQEEADRRTARLRSMLILYDDGWGWRPGNGVMPALAEQHPTAQQLESREEWAAASTAIAGDQTDQQALAL